MAGAMVCCGEERGDNPGQDRLNPSSEVTAGGYRKLRVFDERVASANAKAISIMAKAAANAPQSLSCKRGGSSPHPSGNHFRDIVSRLSDRITCKVGVPSGGLHLRVPEQPADHRQSLT